jgi:hypothetical protein
MAKKPHAGAEPATTTPEAEAGPQGIVIRYSQTGDPRKDFHPKFRDVPMIDAECLVVDGKAPALALPVQGSTLKKAIKRVDPKTAAELLTCDWISGQQPVHRLATDAEVLAMEREAAERADRETAQRAKNEARARGR